MGHKQKVSTTIADLGKILQHDRELLLKQLKSLVGRAKRAGCDTEVDEAVIDIVENKPKRIIPLEHYTNTQLQTAAKDIRSFAENVWFIVRATGMSKNGRATLIKALQDKGYKNFDVKDQMFI